MRARFISPLFILSLLACHHDPPSSPPAPQTTAAFAVGGTAAIGQAVTFDASGSVDAAGGGLSYSWDFGDGSRGGTAKVAHLYAAAGAYTVALVVRDAAGATAAATKAVNVAPGPAATGTASLTGRVSTAAGLPLGGATVAVPGGPSAQSAADGTVSLAGVPAGVPLLMRVTRAGFADQWVRLSALQAGSADGYFQTALRPRSAAVSLAASENGGTATGPSGAQLVLPPGSLVHADGSPVTGAADVTLTPVDVVSEIGAFPGEFRGVEPDGTLTPIATLGVMEVTVSQGGQPLQLAAGRTATLDIPVFTGGAVAGQSIPLWSLDENTGAWVQEGTGTVVPSTASPTGLALRGTVSHLSWWNIDMKFIPFTVNVKCFSQDQQGNLVPLTVACWVWADQQGGSFPFSSPADVVPPGSRAPFLVPPNVPTLIHAITPAGGAGGVLVNGGPGTSQNVDVVVSSAPPFGTVQLVAVGSGSSVAVSDGISWIVPPTPAIGTADAVAWNGSIWLVGGAGIMTSPDGLTWTLSPSANAIFTTGVHAVAWNGSLWVALGDDNLGFKLATSPDGQTWTARTVPAIPQAGQAVAWNGQVWLASGNQFNGFFRSPDGIAWTFVPAPFSSVLALAVDGTGWIALGFDGGGQEIWGRSYDNGDNWSTGALPLNLPMSLAYNGSTWMAGGLGGVASSSDTGITWTNGTALISGGGVAWTGSEWVLVGTDGNGAGWVVKSPDGVNWGIQVPLAVDGRDVAFRRPLYPPWP